MRPYTKRMSVTAATDGQSCLVAFDLSDARREEFVMAASALGSVIARLQQAARECATNATAGTASEPLAAVRTDSIVDVVGAEVLVRAPRLEPVLRMTDAKGLEHVLRLPREIAQSVAQGIQSALSPSQSGH